MENIFSWLYLSLRVVLFGALFSFIGLGISRLINSLKRDQDAINTQTKPIIRLRMEDGHKKPSIEFTVQQFYIGRDPICEFVIDHKTVSSQHAIVSFHHKQWWLEDASSKNGTFLNDLAVEQQTVLTNNDSVGCGNVTVKINIEY